MVAALWVLDYMFTLAANGCRGVNMETGVNQLGFISSYSPIGDDEHGHYSARPEYYGMLAFSLAAKGRLLKTELGSNSPAVKAYATQPEKGPLALALINKGAVASDLAVNTPGRRASFVRLSGPAVDARTGITLGGAEVTSAGTWKPAKSEVLPIRKGQFRINLPAASAAVVHIA